MKSLLALAALAAALSLPGAAAASANPTPHIVSVMPTLGISRAGGWVLYSNGKVNAIDGAPFFGDARKSGLDNFTTIAPSAGGDGYWLVTSTGKVFTYGADIVQACGPGAKVVVPKIVGPIVGATFLSVALQANGNVIGFQMVNAAGNVYQYLCESD